MCAEDEVILPKLGHYWDAPEEYGEATPAVEADPNISAGIAGMAIFFVIGLVSLLEGIFSLRGAKDASKIMPAWIFAIIGVIAGVVGLFTGGSLGGSIFSLIINIVIFIAANNIKKSRKLSQ